MKRYQIFLFTLFLTSCGTKTEVINNTYSTAEPGNIKGTVTLYDTVYDLYSGRLAALTDPSGVKVALEGTSFSTVSDSTGNWELTKIPAGTYPFLTFEKDGFAKDKFKNGNGIYFVGGGGTQYGPSETLYRINRISPNLVIRGFQDFVDRVGRDTIIDQVLKTIYDSIVVTNGEAIFTSRILDNPQSKVYNYYGALYFGRSANIDPQDPNTFVYATCQSRYDLLQTDRITGSIDFPILKTQLQQAGFHSNETIYCISFFGGLCAFNSFYSDPSIGKEICSGFSPFHSEAKSFILP